MRQGTVGVVAMTLT